MSDEKEDSKIEEKTVEVSSSEVSSKIDIVKKAEEAAKEAAKAELELQAALTRVAAAKAAAEEAAEEEYKAIAAEVKADTSKTLQFSNQRKGEEIFRREMGEPEFFLAKKDRFPRPILSSNEQDEMTRKVEIPKDNTPKYIPQHVLSPEFGGISNYESGVEKFLEESKQKLQELKIDPVKNEQQIIKTKKEIAYLESIYENFSQGMNVFRTAKGGRSKFK